MSDADFATIDGIITAMYESISGRKGEPRQWDRDRTLHHPKALLVPAIQATGGRPPASSTSTGCSESEVHHRHLWALLPGRGQRRAGIRHSPHLVAACFQCLHENGAKRIVVFDDEDRGKQLFAVAFAHTGRSRTTEVPLPTEDCQRSDPPI